MVYLQNQGFVREDKWDALLSGAVGVGIFDGIVY